MRHYRIKNSVGVMILGSTISAISIPMDSTYLYILGLICVTVGLFRLIDEL